MFSAILATGSSSWHFTRVSIPLFESYKPVKQFRNRGKKLRNNNYHGRLSFRCKLPFKNASAKIFH